LRSAFCGGFCSDPRYLAAEIYVSLGKTAMVSNSLRQGIPIGIRSAVGDCLAGVSLTLGYFGQSELANWW